MLGERFAPVPHNELTMKVREKKKNVDAGGEAFSFWERDADCGYYNNSSGSRSYLERVCRKTYDL